jgi:hypothetical protein
VLLLFVTGAGAIAIGVAVVATTGGGVSCPSWMIPAASNQLSTISGEPGVAGLGVAIFGRGRDRGGVTPFALTGTGSGSDGTRPLGKGGGNDNGIGGGTVVVDDIDDEIGVIGTDDTNGVADSVRGDGGAESK